MELDQDCNDPNLISSSKTAKKCTYSIALGLKGQDHDKVIEKMEQQPVYVDLLTFAANRPEQDGWCHCSRNMLDGRNVSDSACNQCSDWSFDSVKAKNGIKPDSKYPDLKHHSSPPPPCGCD
eukprot:5745242-Ditylum_brightwellii.AAC.1